MTSSLDLAALSRKELQALAKEFQLCRGNAKSDVILQHVQDFMAANPTDGEARVRAVLGEPAEAAPAPATPTKASEPEPKKSPAATTASPSAKAATAATPPRKADAPGAAAQQKQKTPEAKPATPVATKAKSPAKPATPVQTKQTPEKQSAAASPATKQTPPAKKSPAKQSPAAKASPAAPAKDTPTIKAGRPALASLDANVVAKSATKQQQQANKSDVAASVNALVSSHDDLTFVGDGSRVRCTTTGHEMKADAAVIEAYMRGKSYVRAKLKAQSFAAFAPMFTPHPDAKKAAHLLWCSVTETEHPRDVARIQAHMAGARYQKELPRWQAEEAARVQAQQEAEARAAAKAKARAEKLKAADAPATPSSSKKRKAAMSKTPAPDVAETKETAAPVTQDAAVPSAKRSKRPRKRVRK